MPPRPLLIFGSRPTCLFLSHYFYPLVEYFISGVSQCARKFLGKILFLPFPRGRRLTPFSARTRILLSVFSITHSACVFIFPPYRFYF